MVDDTFITQTSACFLILVHLYPCSRAFKGIYFVLSVPLSVCSFPCLYKINIFNFVTFMFVMCMYFVSKDHILNHAYLMHCLFVCDRTFRNFNFVNFNLDDIFFNDKDLCSGILDDIFFFILFFMNVVIFFFWWFYFCFILSSFYMYFSMFSCRTISKINA
jgi:hypothetical protein